MEYRYGMRLRGFSIGCQPKEGLIGVDRECGDVPLPDNPRRFYHDILIYDRKLTKEEREQYDLDEL